MRVTIVGGCGKLLVSDLLQPSFLSGFTLDEARAAAAFNDAQDVASYAKEAVTVMSQAGIINGVGNDKFDPKGTATRAQAAVFLYG